MRKQSAGINEIHEHMHSAFTLWHYFIFLTGTSSFIKRSSSLMNIFPEMFQRI